MASTPGSGYLQFKIDYSAAARRRRRRATVQTKHVSAGGHLWRVRCYPYRLGLGDVSVFFDLPAATSTAPAPIITAVLEAFLIGSDGSPSRGRRSVVSCSPGADPAKPPRPWGWPRVAGGEKDDWRLQSHEYLNGGHVTVLCGVIVLGGGEPAGPSAVGQLGSHLGGLLDNDLTSDVSFLVGGETVKAHRAVLAARSPVFKAALFGPMAEAQMAHITLENLDPDTFRNLLRFIYTDDDNNDKEQNVLRGLRLLAAADRYGVGGLKHACEQRRALTAGTAAAALECAEMHGLPGLRKRCVDFLVAKKGNLRKAAATEAYGRLFPWVIQEIEDKAKRREERKQGALADEVGSVLSWSRKRSASDIAADPSVS
ncbi:BTB/POZ and MATH domain-containing protein 1 [Brachypodium distachyon]|uniref:BTB domain-containing protein n=1 Tax=Brachypodium distachyon TaxID=15368 RepID=A0A2K2D2C8_BRADI|nr:BTB/POZ and MATH domain-containing protein 1 [Brachypodium distachyon]PNT68444.1 hypothetical protein BRADI_3g40715v3 [Brachypodium distachyon]|eukprot:XP_010236760.1 BTB/POZ and MATH domain-containing protein 1 [Brachypodium distachyon]